MKKTNETAEAVVTEAVEAAAEVAVAEEKPAKKTTRKRNTKKAEESAAEAPVAEEKPAKKTTRKRTTKKAEEAAEEKPAKKTTKKATAKKTTKKAEVETAEEKTAKKTRKRTTKKAEEVAPVVEAPVEAAPAAEEAPVAEVVAPVEEIVEAPVEESPRRSVVFIGSECYPFVKSGGLGDVMYALPKELARQNCDVRVIIPNYACIKPQHKEKMEFRGAFDMDLCADGRRFYVGIMEYVEDGVVYDFIDNEEFFSNGNPYTTIVDDIPKFCYFGKAALAALLYMDWIPDVIHCHDWQAGLVPIYLREFFGNTKLGNSKSVITIHNLRFQGIYNIETIQYWSGLPDYVFNKDCLKQAYNDANMFKGGLAYANMITTVSRTYADEIQTEFFGENLDAHLRYHSNKLRGIVNGIDVDTWNPATDPRVEIHYDAENVIEKKVENKLALQEEVGVEKDADKFVIGLISRLTDQKGLDLVNAIIPEIIDGNTQVIVLGTGDPVYEDSFRYYEETYKGTVSSSIMYDETRAHHIYAGSDALLVPSLFEPCGLTQLNAMRYGTVPIVRETGGLKDTVAPYNEFENSGNGFTFDRYEVGLLLDCVNRAKTLYFTDRERWNQMVVRDMYKDVSWESSAKQYKDLYLELTQR